MDISTYFYSAAAILFVSASGLAFLLRHVRKVTRELTGAVSGRFSSDEIICIDSSASFLGRASLKYRQIRGNGVLVLTRGQVFFRRLFPELEFSIPLRTVRKVETPRSFQGKSVFRPLLKIDYKTDTGDTDSVAWCVSDLKNFIKGLEKLMHAP
jgi:hypothetical protein